MKKYVNGKYIPLTQAEIDSMQQLPEAPTEPDLEAQVENIKAEVETLKAQLAGERADMAAALDLLGVTP